MVKRILLILPLIILVVGTIWYSVNQIKKQKPEILQGKKTLVLCSVVAPAVAGKTAPLSIGHNQVVGDFYADGFCRSLYVSSKDKPGTSNCYDACAQTWIPYLVPASSQDLTAFKDNLTPKAMTITRKDGSKQYAVDGFPLYHYVEDKYVGQVYGHLVDPNWDVLKTDIKLDYDTSVN